MKGEFATETGVEVDMLIRTGVYPTTVYLLVWKPHLQLQVNRQEIRIGRES